MAENKEEKKEEIKAEAPTPKVEKAKEEKKFEPVKAGAETKKTAKTTAKPKEEKAKKKKSIFLRTISVVLVLLIVIGLIYIALPSPARTLQQAMRSLKAGNYEKLEEYMDYNQLMSASVLSTENEEQNKLFFEDLEFVVKEWDTATIQVETTNKDFKKVVQNAVTNLLQQYFSSESTEIGDVLLEELKNEDVGTTSTTQTITVQKIDGKWKVIVDDNLRSAIFPGLVETLETLTNGSAFSN